MYISIEREKERGRTREEPRSGKVALIGSLYSKKKKHLLTVPDSLVDCSDRPAVVLATLFKTIVETDAALCADLDARDVIT